MFNSSGVGMASGRGAGSSGACMRMRGAGAGLNSGAGYDAPPAGKPRAISASTGCLATGAGDCMVLGDAGTKRGAGSDIGGWKEPIGAGID